ncbi:amidase family protein [Muricoccus vinaceus]|uniref:Amidase family protein n=1 Tax=Muricoccus vinaceus TaxID=424704 RepID=A0ABV6IZS1_9PROT
MDSIPQTTPRRRPFLSRSGGFAEGVETPRAFLEECLEDLERWEPRIGAFTVVDMEGARDAADASATRWRQNRALSAIDGMPGGVKDILDTDTMPTQMGSPLYDGYQPRFSGTGARALRDAGAVILGKTVTTEFAGSEPRGTRNPWDTARTPGGGSSGSAAAVAAGIVSGALGTQVVGSIVRPAGFCGVVGYKPSVGGINRGGSLDMPSQGCTGTLAASLGDAWVLARAMAERVGGAPGYPGLGGPLAPPEARRPARLGLLRTAGWPVLEPGARRALEEALDRLRAAGIEVVGPEDCPERDPEALSASVHEHAALGRRMTRDNYAALLERRAAARAAFAAVSARCDAVVSVTAPGAAPPGLGSTGNPVFVVPGSLLGMPVLTLPVLRSEGLPLDCRCWPWPTRMRRSSATPPGWINESGAEARPLLRLLGPRRVVAQVPAHQAYGALGGALADRADDGAVLLHGAGGAGGKRRACSRWGCTCA